MLIIGIVVAVVVIGVAVWMLQPKVQPAPAGNTLSGDAASSAIDQELNQATANVDISGLESQLLQ